MSDAPADGYVPNSSTQLSALYDGVERVYYLDTNNHVREAQFTTAGAWSTVDWTAAVGNVPAPLRDAIAGISDFGNVNHAFYVDTANHVRELWHYGTTFGSVDVTAATGDTAVVGAPALTVYSDNAGMFHVDFIGQDSRIHEYVRSNYNTFTVPQSGAPMYSDSWTNAGLVQPGGGNTPILASRQLTSTFDWLRLTAQVFDLSPNGLPGQYYVLDQSNFGSGWSLSVPSSTPGASVAFP